MLYRPRAVAFLVPGGVDNFADDVKALLFSLNYSRADYCPDYRDDPNYNDEPVLWIDQKDLDIVLQNETFWGYLIEGSVIPYVNFNIKVVVSSAEDAMFSNDNVKIYKIADENFIFSFDDLYLSNEEYQTDFVLTAEYVETIPDIKTWIRERGIDSNFDLRKSDAVLKEGVKQFYSITEEINNEE